MGEKEYKRKAELMFQKNTILINQLAKAKELLKRCYDNYIYLQPLRDEIEDFLKE